MTEERKNDEQQVKPEAKPPDDPNSALEKDSAYAKKAMDQSGRDWSKRKTFKPQGTV